tara:strand:+ start:220 stop:480 length:261 start_codon:yes stop_codon:yes gene_type:complete
MIISSITTTEIQIGKQAIQSGHQTLLLLALRTVNPSQNGAISISKFLQVDPIRERHLCTMSDAATNLLKSEPGGGCEHDQARFDQF